MASNTRTTAWFCWAVSMPHGNLMTASMPSCRYADLAVQKCQRRVCVPDHVEVWLADNADPGHNPNLGLVLAQADSRLLLRSDYPALDAMD